MVSIGRALVTGARCILFDELSLGLAPRIVTELGNTVRGLADEGRVIVHRLRVENVEAKVASFTLASLATSARTPPTRRNSKRESPTTE